VFDRHAAEEPVRDGDIERAVPIEVAEGAIPLASGDRHLALDEGDRDARSAVSIQVADCDGGGYTGTKPVGAPAVFPSKTFPRTPRIMWRGRVTP